MVEFYIEHAVLADLRRIGRIGLSDNRPIS